MSKAISFLSYVAGKEYVKEELKQDYLSEANYYVDCLVRDSNKLAELQEKKFAFFKNLRVQLLEANIAADKEGIELFTELYSGIDNRVVEQAN